MLNVVADALAKVVPLYAQDPTTGLWHCFTLSRYDRNTGSWAMEKAPVYHIID